MGVKEMENKILKYEKYNTKLKKAKKTLTETVDVLEQKNRGLTQTMKSER